MPTPQPYLDAVRRARATMGLLDARAAAAIEEALTAYAEELERELAQLPVRRQRAALARSVEIIRSAAVQLEVAIGGVTQAGLTITFAETLAIWRTATEAVAASRIPDALLGAVRVPAVTVAGAFEAVQPAATWRTLLRSHVVDAASEASRIMRAGLLAGESPVTLARKLRRYVEGGEDIARLFPTGTIDLRQIPPELRGAAKRMRYNAERIAFSEVHNARAEAEVQHFQADPLVEAVQWELSPNRGKVQTPDICDVLATQDLYGLGPGIYPVGQVPPSPHPFDRCERIPVTRDFEQAGEAKPAPALQVRPDAVTIPGADRLTPRGAARIREQLGTLLAAE